MKKVFYLFVMLLFVFASVSFSACSKENKISFSGLISYGNEAMVGVVIKTSDRALCITDEEGEFKFESSLKNIKIYPEKEGYYFEPEFVIVTEESPECSFIAKKTTPLVGKLTLKKVIIKPTYIVSYSDDYLYSKDNKDCLKVFDISLKHNEKIFTISTENMFLYKNEKNEIEIEEDINITCGSQSQIGFIINTYFKYNYYESHTAYTEYSYLYIAGDQTNNKLQNNQIEYSLIGINNKSNKFTFNITFIFDYSELETELV